MFKKFSYLFLALVLILATSTTAFAKDKDLKDLKKVTYDYLPSVEESTIDDDVQSRTINGIPITVKGKTDGTGVEVYVGNIGIDPLDRVTVTVTATGYSSPKTQSAVVYPVVGKTFDFYFPMIKVDTTYSATITVVDGSGTVTKYGSARLVYNENNLLGLWNAGTFLSRAASLQYHFDKHKTEVSSNNIVDYLNKAMNYRAEVLNDIAKNNLSKYYVTAGTGTIPSTKYKNIVDGRFIILVNVTKEALSFGR